MKPTPKVITRRVPYCFPAVQRHLLLGVIALLISATGLFAQKRDTADKMTVNLRAANIIHITTDSGEVNKFIGNAVFQQGTDTLYCDSLYDNVLTRLIEAFGHVHIVQLGGTQGYSDYLRYISSTKMAFMKGKVTLTDGKNRLWCDELTYDLGNKVGTYDHKGTLQADSTTVFSQAGEYNVRSKDARFKGNVIVTDPQYHTRSADMGYNTETKLTRFFDSSIVVGDSGRSLLQTTNGTYDSHNSIAHFESHSSIWYQGQYIEGDTLDYNKPTGYGYAYGHVIALDTAHHSTMYCGKAKYNQKKRIMWSLEKPLLVQVKGIDTIYMRADTFYSAPIPKSMLAPLKKDSLSRIKAIADSGRSLKNAAAAVNRTVAKIDSAFLQNEAPGQQKSGITNTANKGKNKKGKNKAVQAAITATLDTAADTTAPLYFTGYHHVRIYSDSLQGVCDSIVYTQSDSTIRMIYNPIVWSRNSQITGDTILLLLDSNKLKTLYVPNNAFVVSLAATERAKLYDQVQGRTLKGFFTNNAITSMIVYPYAEVIYYP